MITSNIVLQKQLSNGAVLADTLDERNFIVDKIQKKSRMIKCIIIEQDSSARRNLEDKIKTVDHLSFIKSFKSLEEAKDSLKEQPIDLIFLDMPSAESNGIGVLDDLSYSRPSIIVTSTNKNVALHAFEINALDFMLKPVSNTQLLKSLSKVLKATNSSIKKFAGHDASLFIKVEKRFVRIDLKDVYLIEALADYVIINTNEKRYTVHATMKAIEAKLPKKDFMRVHKSFIIRLDSIHEMKGDKIIIKKQSIPISTSYRKELKDRLKIL